MDPWGGVGGSVSWNKNPGTKGFCSFMDLGPRGWKWKRYWTPSQSEWGKYLQGFCIRRHLSQWRCLARKSLCVRAWPTSEQDSLTAGLFKDHSALAVHQGCVGRADFPRRLPGKAFVIGYGKAWTFTHRFFFPPGTALLTWSQSNFLRKGKIQMTNICPSMWPFLDKYSDSMNDLIWESLL